MAISAEKAFDHTKLPFQPFTYMSNDNPRNKRLLLSFMQHQELMEKNSWEFRELNPGLVGE